MEVIRTAGALRAAADTVRRSGGEVALVPTMGALHEGHRALILAAAGADLSIVSTFVNPTQFGRNEDFERYPRDEAADVALAAEAGADLVWAPPAEEVYPSGVSLPRPDPGPVGHLFEGASRPGHFAGVLQVVRRLLDLTGPCTAWFGEKDAQQLFLVRRMVVAEGLAARIASVPTVREPDGLACSSRNANLSSDEREQAGCLFLALSEAAERARVGERDPRVLIATMAREIGATPLARLDHAAIVDDRTFLPVDRLGPDVPARALVAAVFGRTRLIDNLALPSAS
jgi:pantoate--beta-alanine ligase